MQRGKLASTDRRYNTVLDSDLETVEIEPISGFALFLALELSPRPFQVFHDLLALTFENFQNLPSFRGFFDLTQFRKSKLASIKTQAVCAV